MEFFAFGCRIQQKSSVQVIDFYLLKVGSRRFYYKSIAVFVNVYFGFMEVFGCHYNWRSAYNDVINDESASGSVSFIYHHSECQTEIGLVVSAFGQSQDCGLYTRVSKIKSTVKVTVLAGSSALSSGLVHQPGRTAVNGCINGSVVINHTFKNFACTSPFEFYRDVFISFG